MVLLSSIPSWSTELSVLITGSFLKHKEGFLLSYQSFINTQRACVVRVTVVIPYVCVWEVKNQKEFGINVRKER